MSIPLCELEAQTGPVWPLEQAGTEIRVHAIGRIEDFMCDSSMQKLTVSSVFHRALRGELFEQQASGRH
jgi:hypothetical protein